MDRARLSARGDWVVFFSDAGNLGEGEPDGEAAVLVHEIASGLTQRMQDDEDRFEDNVNR